MNPNSRYAQPGAGSIKSEGEARSQGMSAVQLWLAKIAAQKTDKDFSSWYQSAKEALGAYESGSEDQSEDQISSAQLFYSNVEIVTPSVYNTTPVPDIRPRFNDYNPVIKAGADLFERIVTADMDESDFDDVILDAVMKLQVVGEGLARVRYDCTFKSTPILDEFTGEPIVDDFGNPVVRSEIDHDKVWLDVVPWDRIVFGPGRKFGKCQWIAFEHDLTYHDVQKLNKDRADELTFGNASHRVVGRYLSDKSVSADAEKAGIFSTIKAYEIWDMETRTVIWIAEQDDISPIRHHKDPFRLRQFFPLLPPLAPRKKFDSRLPKVPYAKHKRLYKQFDRLLERIDTLVSMCKVSGFADAKVHNDITRIRDLMDGEFVSSTQAEAWVTGRSGSKLSDAISYWPLDQIIAAITQLDSRLNSIKVLIWEVVGVNDVMRGASDPSETLGAQEMKAQYGSMRLRSLQTATQTYCSYAINIMAEVRANVTPWERLKKIAMMNFEPTEEMQAQAQQLAQQQLQQSQQPQIDPSTGQQIHAQIDPAILQQMTQQIATQLASEFEQKVKEVCKSPHRDMIIDIETDSTIRADVSRDMEQFNGLITATGNFATSVGALAPIRPQAVGPLFKVYASQVRKFSLGSEGEKALDDLISQTDQPPPAAPTISPEQAAEAEAQRSHEQSLQDKKIQEKQVSSQGAIAKIEAQTSAKAQEVEISRQQGEVDNANADAQLQRDVTMAKVQSELGVGMEQLKQSGAAAADDRKKQQQNGILPGGWVQ